MASAGAVSRPPPSLRKPAKPFPPKSHSHKTNTTPSQFSATTRAATTKATTTTTPFQTFTSLFREAHPIGRVPTYLKPHDAPAITHYLRRMGRTGKMFVPFMVAFCKSLHPSIHPTFLPSLGFHLDDDVHFSLTMMLYTVGWPFLMKGLINANNGVKMPVKEKEKARKSSKIGRKNAIDSEAWSQRVPA